MTNEEMIEWSGVVPKLNFKEHWDVRIIPPFLGALVRFWVYNKDKKASVYLDVENSLGYEDGPYWELYDRDKMDVERFAMEDTAGLMKAIENVLG